MPVCNRRSTPSVHTLWQERMSPRSCSERKSRGRLCSVALAIASFLVFVAVLSIAGMALYMGALHTEPPSSSSELYMNPLKNMQVILLFQISFLLVVVQKFYEATVLLAPYKKKLVDIDSN